MSLNKISKEIESMANPEKAVVLQRFFKTGLGQYGEGDVFLGLTVPAQRAIARKYGELSLLNIDRMLHSKIHEFRLVALLILVDKYRRAESIKTRGTIVSFYLKNTKRINNWDLVDLSAHQILGEFLLLNPSKKKVLSELAQSKNLWEKRIAMVSTYAFIRRGQSVETTRIAKELLGDKHDLIHKAVGWMLREVGNMVDEKILIKFLDKHSHQMARTTLRYAIERLSPIKRKYYLNK